MSYDRGTQGGGPGGSGRDRRGPLVAGLSGRGLPLWAALCLLLAVPAAGAAETVCLSTGDWPPYTSQSLPGDGSGPRLVAEAFRRVGIETRFRFFPWKRAMEAALKGPCEGSLIWVKTPERERDFLYSDSLFEARDVFFHLKEVPFTWNGIEDLRGIPIGAVLGDAALGVEGRRAASEGRLRVEWVGDYPQNFKKLLHGRIKACLVTQEVGYFLLRRDFPPQVAARFTHHPRAMLVDTNHVIFARNKQRSPGLLERFNHGLAILRQEGALERILSEGNSPAP
jgi:polar amino acid transport system substrate-binding protein